MGRHIQTDTQTETHRHTQTDRHTDRHTDRQTDTHRQTHTDRQTDRQTHRQTDRQTDTATTWLARSYPWRVALVLLLFDGLRWYGSASSLDGEISRALCTNFPNLGSSPVLAPFALCSFFLSATSPCSLDRSIPCLHMCACFFLLVVFAVVLTLASTTTATNQRNQQS